MNAVNATGMNRINRLCCGSTFLADTSPAATSSEAESTGRTKYGSALVRSVN
jgi:hypothetical protein